MANDAMMMPGRSMGRTGPVVLNPSAGSWPAVPGRCLIVSPTSTPPRISGGMGHHAGSPLNPRSAGKVVNTYCWTSATHLRKKYATSATGTPTRAPMTSTST